MGQVLIVIARSASDVAISVPGVILRSEATKDLDNKITYIISQRLPRFARNDRNVGAGLKTRPQKMNIFG
jgi:hypothetical protein